jgi:FkbM family methyltransferase
MKGLINFESIWRRSLKGMGKYYQWLFWQQKNIPTTKMKKMQTLYGQFVKEGNLCFDIGANMGSRVATFLMLKAKVVAVEPQQVCVEQLKKVFKKESVTIVEKGVGAKNEVKEFFLADDSLISSFSQEWITGMKNEHFSKNKWDKVEQIEIITLDMLMQQYGVPDFIKIDTEGFELEVIKGLSNQVNALSFEYTLPDQNNKAMACLELLDQLYLGKIELNICRDEAYEMYYKDWVGIGEMKKLISDATYNNKNFGSYGDIYVKKLPQQK